MPRCLRGLGTLLGLSLLFATGSVLPGDTQAQSDQRCFAETGYCISGPIRAFYEQHGDITVFGLPLTPQQEEYIGLLTSTAQEQFLPGKRLQVQRFERNRLELHPDGVVRVGRLGAEILEQQGRSWFSFSKSQPQPGCQFFPETGHNICGNILQAWNAYGGLDMVGFPLSDEQREMLEDGNEYTVQWFERARFQLSPGRGARFDVELGRLGALDLCANVPSPVNIEVSPSTCLVRGVRGDLAVSGFVPNSTVQVWYVAQDGMVYPPAEGTFSFTADENGGASDLFYTSDRDTFNRIDYYILQGTENRTAIVYFKVVNPALTPSDTAMISGCQGIPAKANGLVTPLDQNRQPTGAPTRCATRQVDLLAVEAYGFVPGESVSVRTTGPDGQNFPAAAPLTANAEGQVRQGFQSSAYRDRPGLYTFFFQGSTPQGANQVPNIAVIPVKIVTSDITPPPDSMLRITNASNATVCFVNFSLTTETYWRSDRLGPSETIAPGATRSFEVEPGVYDIRLLNCDQQELAVQTGIAISGIYEFRLTGQ